MDFSLKDNLDLQTSDDEYLFTDENEPTLLTALFTDARENKRNGYWLDLLASTVWTKYQSRLTTENALLLNEDVKELTEKVVADGLYARIESDVTIVGGVMRLVLSCYNSENVPVLQRIFVVS